MSLVCKVQIRIANLPKTVAVAVQEALAPDNVKFPPGQSVKMNTQKDALIITVEGGTIAQFIATVDELLEHAHVALEVTAQ